MFQTHRDTNHVRPDAGGHLLLRIELAVRGAGRVADQGAGVADVDQMAHELRRFDEPDARLQPALQAEGQQA